MCNSIVDKGIGLPFFEVEPFSRREAWNWLATNTKNGKIRITLRYLAIKWKWHKSKVERFIKYLKEESLIETEIEAGKTSIIICNLAILSISELILKANSETVADTELSTRDKISLVRGNSEIVLNPPKMQVTKGLFLNIINKDEADSRQDRSRVEQQKKKEKKQKKEKDIKEKNIPYGNTKKEKVAVHQVVCFSSINITGIREFAASLAMDDKTLEWELAKFSDHLKSSHRKPPKDVSAAFRNWLRRSIEFKRVKGKDVQISQTRSANPTSFERFFAGATRVLAERERSRLDRR